MSYESNEDASIQSLLVELYEFRVGVLTYRYTSSDVDKIPDQNSGQVYESEFHKRTKIGQSDELNRENITIDVNQSHAIAKLYWGRPPDQTIAITVRRYHEANVLEQDVKVAWSGRVLSCSFKDDTASLVCESTATSMKQPGLTRKYQGSCPHALYGTKCLAVKASYEFLTTVGAVSGTTIDATGASAYPDDHFTGGFLNWLGSDGNIQSRMIVAHTGEELSLDWAIDNLDVLDQIWVYPGCKRTMTDCFNKFTNIENYGGFPYVPDRNPYDTTVF